MPRLRDAALALLSRDASGLLIAALVAALGWLLRATGAPLWLAALPLLAAAVLALMSLRHLLTLARTRGRASDELRATDHASMACAAYGRRRPGTRRASPGRSTSPIA